MKTLRWLVHHGRVAAICRRCGYRVTLHAKHRSAPRRGVRVECRCVNARYPASAEGRLPRGTTVLR